MRILHRLAVGLFACVWIICSGSAVAETLPVPRKLVFAADTWCPYNCTQQDALPGYLVELAIQIYGSKGYQVEYLVMPWKRAIEMAHKGEIDGVLAVCDVEAAGLVVTSKPVGIMQNRVATATGKSFIWKGVESIGQRKAALINGYGYGDDLLAWAAAHSNQVDYSVGADALESMLKKLVAGRVDFLQDDVHVLEYRIDRMNIKKHIVLQPEGESYPLRIGFSPARSDSAELAKIFDQGVEVMRRNGQLKKVLQRYKMSDWLIAKKS